MSALGSLVVKLALEYAQYTGGLDKSEQATLASLKKIQGAADQFSSSVTNGLKNVAGTVVALFGAGALASHVKAVVDELDRMADAAPAIGLTVQALGELGYAATLAGSDALSLEGAMGKLNLKVQSAINGNKEAKQVFSALGVSLTDASGKVRATDDILAELSDTFKNLPEGPTKSALAVELFSKSGAGIVQFLSQGSDGIRALREEFKALAGGDVERSAEIAGAFNDQLDKMKVLSNAATLSFSNELLPTLTELASMFTATGEESLGLNDSLNAVTSGGGALLRTFLETVLLLGSDVVYIFNGIGREIGGIVAQFQALGEGGGIFSAEGRRAWTEVGDAMRADADEAARKLEEFQRRLTTAGQSKPVAESSLEDSRRGAMREAQSKAQADAESRAAAALRETDAAAKATEDAYKKLMERVQERIHLADQELSLGRELTEGEKFEAKAKEDLAKIASKLSASKVAEARTEIETVKKKIDQTDLEKQILKELTALALERQRVRNADYDSVTQWMAQQKQEAQQTLKSINDRLQGLKDEEEAATIARDKNISLAEAIERVAIARLREKQEWVYEGSERWLEIEQEIKAREKLLGLLAKKEVREREQKGWADMWSSVDQTAHDVFTNVLDGGMSAFKRLGQTLKASVLDVLYQMTVRKWIISIGTSIFGGGFGAAANAATGQGGLFGTGGVMDGFSSLSGIASLGKNIYSAITGGFSGLANEIAYTVQRGWNAVTGASYGAPTGAAGMVGSVGAAAAGIAGGVFGGRLISGGYSAFGGSSGNSAVNLGAGAGAAIGSIVPGIGTALGGLVGGLIGGAVNRLFGRKLKDSGIEGDFGGDSGFEGRTFQYYKGGLFRSNKTKYGELDEDARSELAQQYMALRGSTEDMAETLGLGVDALDGFTAHIKLSLKDLSEEEIAAAFAADFAKIGDDLADLVLVTDEYTRSGESSREALTRLSVSLVTANAAFDVMGRKLFDASLAGADMASDLVDAFGGVDAFVSSSGKFVELFYTSEERLDAMTRSLAKSFADLGFELPKSRDELKELANGIDLTTEEGRKLYAQLLALAPALAEITVSAEELAAQRFALNQRLLEAEGKHREALELRRKQEYDALMRLDPELAKMVARIYELEDAAAAVSAAEVRQDAALAALQRAVSVQREILEDARADAEAAAQAWRGIVDIAHGAMVELRGQTASTAAAQAARGWAFIEDSLASVLRGSGAPDAGELSDAIAAARSGLTAGNYMSQTELDRDRQILAGYMAQLQAAGGKELTAAEQLQASTDKQIAQLDEQLDYWEEQVALSRGQLTAVISVAAAIDNLRKELFPDLGGAPGAPAGGGGSGSSAGGITWGNAQTPKYSRPMNYSGGTVYVGVGAEEEKRLDQFYAGYHAFDGTNDADGLARWIKENGLTVSDMSGLSGLFGSDWEKWFAGYGIPAFDVGTNWVPEDMLALVHRGERIVPEADNRRLMTVLDSLGTSYVPHAQIYGARNGGPVGGVGAAEWSAVVSLVDGIRLGLEGLKSGIDDTATAVKFMAGKLDDWDGGPGLRVRPMGVAA